MPLDSGGYYKAAATGAEQVFSLNREWECFSPTSISEPHQFCRLPIFKTSAIVKGEMRFNCCFDLHVFHRLVK